MKKIILLLMLTPWMLTDQLSAQNTVGLISYKEWASSDGYNLFFPHNQSTVFLVNNCGEIVHSWEDEEDYVPGNIAYLTESGLLYKAKRSPSIVGDPIWAGGGGAILEIRDWDNNLVWDFEMNDSLQRLHHDFAVMPNGNILALAWEFKSTEECIAAGRDTSTLSQGVLWPDWVFEIDPFNDTIVWEWHSWDHLVQDFDPTKENYGVIADHPELIDLNYGRPDGHPDWHHGNALDYNPELDQVILSIPYFDELWIIDHSTTTEQAAGHNGGLSNRGGDLLYRWGNPLAYGRGEVSDQKLFFQHDTHWIDDYVGPTHPYYGKIGVFNNRFAADFSVANVITPNFDMYTWSYEMSEGVFLPEDYDVTIAHPDTTALHSTGLSSVQFLANGNVLMISGRFGYAFELTPEGELVWEYITPLRGGDPVSQGEQLSINNNLTFRIKRYPVDFPAFTGKDLSGKAYIELNPDTSYCQSLTSTSDAPTPFSVNIYPNPAAEYVMISKDDASPVEVLLMDAQGRIIKGVNGDSDEIRLNLTDVNNGIYMLNITSERRVHSRPLIILH